MQQQGEMGCVEATILRKLLKIGARLPLLSDTSMLLGGIRIVAIHADGTGRLGQRTAYLLLRNRLTDRTPIQVRATGLVSDGCAFEEEAKQAMAIPPTMNMPDPLSKALI